MAGSQSLDLGGAALETQQAAQKNSARHSCLLFESS